MPLKFQFPASSLKFKSNPCTSIVPRKPLAIALLIISKSPSLATPETVLASAILANGGRVGDVRGSKTRPELPGAIPWPMFCRNLGVSRSIQPASFSTSVVETAERSTVARRKARSAGRRGKESRGEEMANLARGSRRMLERDEEIAKIFGEAVSLGGVAC